MPGPGYPAYLYGPPGGPRRAPGTDGFAIAALVFSILGGIVLAVIFALVALKRIRRSGDRGKGLAVSALVISGVWVLVIAVIAVLVLVVGASSDRDPTGEITAPGSVAVDELRVGDCLAGLPQEGRVHDADTVPCSTPHRAQVYATFTLPKGDYPGDEQVAAQAEEGCGDRATDLDSDDDEKLGLFLLYPRRVNWSLGDRAVICVAESKDGTMTGSLLP